MKLKIQKDNKGLFVKPSHKAYFNGDTRFKIDEIVDVHQFWGTIDCGVGKDSTCKRGEYLEIWTIFEE